MFKKLHAIVFFTLAGLAWSGVALRANDKAPENKASEISIGSTEPTVAFHRYQFNVSRHHGKIFLDGNEVSQHILETKGKELKLIETFDGLSFPTNRQFLNWAHKIKGTRTYTYDEVTQVNSDGSSATQPLVFFSKDQRMVLDTSWHAWLDKRQAELDEANRIRSSQEHDAKIYQQQLHLQQLQSQSAAAQAAAAEKSAASLAVISGETSLWEIELVPVGSFGSSYGSYRGTQTTGVTLVSNGRNSISTLGSLSYGHGYDSLYVRAYGRTSAAASDQAIHNNPGYRAGSIRKIAGY